ncbi:MAG: Holliday junction resolvase RuvX [Bacteroidetes bacterium]|nr:Holliday junction resolvase RuvX [Bacteroidota bacterium]
MGKLIGIDYGLKRTGFAMTDELQIIASPLETIPSKEAFNYIEKLIADNVIDAIILGEPRYLDGSESQMTRKVHTFKQELEKKFRNMEVILEDETYSSKLALESLIASGAKKKKRREKGILDKISASLILQSYMERRSGGI